MNNTMTLMNEFLNWIDDSKHFSDEDGLPDLNMITELKFSPDRKVCWAIGRTSVGNQHSVIFDDTDNDTIQDLDYYRNWEEILNSHKKMFAQMV